MMAADAGSREEEAGVEPTPQERLIGTYWEARTIISFEVSPVALQEWLPDGWGVGSLDTDSSRGANLVVNLVEQVMVQNASDESQANCLIATFSSPAKPAGTAPAATMVLTGFASSGQYVPGVYGNFVLATASIERTARFASPGISSVRESWEFRGETGDRLTLEIAYIRGQPIRSVRSATIRSAKLSAVHRIYRIDQAVDTLYSAAQGTNLLQTYAFQASGERLARLFDGTERLASIASSACFRRQVFVPQ
jgi:hypothetical protein